MSSLSCSTSHDVQANAKVPEIILAANSSDTEFTFLSGTSADNNNPVDEKKSTLYTDLQSSKDSFDIPIKKPINLDAPISATSSLSTPSQSPSTSMNPIPVIQLTSQQQTITTSNVIAKSQLIHENEEDLPASTPATNYERMMSEGAGGDEKVQFDDFSIKKSRTNSDIEHDAHKLKHFQQLGKATLVSNTVLEGNKGQEVSFASPLANRGGRGFGNQRSVTPKR